MEQHPITMRTFSHGDNSDITMFKREMNTLACKEREKEGRVTLKDLRL
jgi:hypothetical protein